ncbi:hypothetical protein LEM8419_01122 [Neolewinella maritima]|uniref:Secreted protein n=1 Tax=Neolewinella maritima TaxID=1383882 RepID=A0ABM9AZR0_9BACT|nr:hypothetical protein [Neolewinella maritima]CAH0999837.1 hypothetical protein LEM8419_01122 [Neolewinella maritima]
MNKLFTYSLLLCLALAITACGDESIEESQQSIDSENASEHNDSDANDDGEVTYEEQSARGVSTTNTTNYAQRADSIRTVRDTLVTPTYTDDEYEAAYSTSTTNPANQVEGGITPGDEQKRKQ